KPLDHRRFILDSDPVPGAQAHHLDLRAARAKCRLYILPMGEDRLFAIIKVLQRWIKKACRTGRWNVTASLQGSALAEQRLEKVLAHLVGSFLLFRGGIVVEIGIPHATAKLRSQKIDPPGKIVKPRVAIIEIKKAIPAELQ